MKKLLFIIALLGYNEFLYAQHTPEFKKLEWLIGTWQRTNLKAGKTAHEQWVKTSDNMLVGTGLSMRGADTSFVEKLKIVIIENALYYVSDVPENKHPVNFKMTSVTANGFVCENPTHDFPKKIEYVVEGNKLKATISGDGKAIDYWFERR